MKLTIAFSPCPNDTFIFDALVNRKIDTGDLEFEAVLEDVETLNRNALKNKWDISKLSFPAFFQSIDQYILLNSGSALGKGVGPLLIAAKAVHADDAKIQNALVALPGENTTANLLFDFAFPALKNKKFMIFSDIENAVLNGDCDLGVIIHENRFTYADKGLFKIADLGEEWERKMNIPVPLGGIAIKRDIDAQIALKVEDLIRDSLTHSYLHYPELSSYVTENAQEMEDKVMRQHIDLYVNDYTKDLGEEGREAIRQLYRIYEKNGERKTHLFL
jgi:1,4-dihydroxy-6-naphthoate synthase